MQASIQVCTKCGDIKGFHDGERITINGIPIKFTHKLICKKCKGVVKDVRETDPEFDKLFKKRTLFARYKRRIDAIAPS